MKNNNKKSKIETNGMQKLHTYRLILIKKGGKENA